MDEMLPLMPGKPSVSLWRSEVEKLDNPFRYAGEYRDQETGLYYLRARYYDPQIQRFISEDSLAKSPNWQQHVYAYCGYNPVNFIDPSGYAYVWNRFGEVIGTTEDSSYTDYSQKASDTHGGTADVVNSPWDGDSDAPEIGNLINNYYNEAINEVIKGNATWEDLSIVSKTISYSGVKDDLIRAKAGNYYNGEIISDISSGVDLIPGKQLAYAQIIMRGAIFLKNIYNSLVNKVAGKAESALINGLRQSGVKFSEEAMVGITKTPGGRTVWLETGNANAGLEHIVTRHSKEFASWGLSGQKEIVKFIINTVGNQPGVQRGGAMLYDVSVGGMSRQLQVVIGNNGYIVTAYPFSR